MDIVKNIIKGIEEFTRLNGVPPAELEVTPEQLEQIKREIPLSKDATPGGVGRLAGVRVKVAKPKET